MRSQDPKEDNQMPPLLSVIIANYNYGRFLPEAIESVLSQRAAENIELIICDGKSTDDSVKVIKHYSSHIAWWCSEKDGGQSNAFNKGFSHSNGRFLTWLNADDVMLPHTFENLKKATYHHPKCEWFVGGTLWLDPQMRIINCGRGRSFSHLRYSEGNVSVWGPSSFFTKHLLDEVGGVDERFHYTMDTDLWLRFASQAKARYKPFCNYAWGLRLHPQAKMSGHNFTSNGSLDLHHPEKDRIARNKHLSQIQKEAQLRAAYFKARKGTFLTRLLSASWRQVLGAKLDLLHWKGKHYSEVFS